MKRFSLILGLLLLLSCVGCSDSGSKITTSGTSSVDQVLESQAEAATAEEDPESTEVAVEVEATEASVEADAAPEEDLAEVAVDYDLTAMSSDMVYATVYQMLTNPEEYAGCTVRMSGVYYAAYYSVTELYYHYCIIADASSCCSQGMEFVCTDDGSDFPADYTEIIVVGTFGSYEELGVTYNCLLEATIESVA